MILISISRIIKFAMQDFIRNFWISIVTITILILSLFSINFLIVAGVISEAAIKTVEDKIDLSLYLSPNSTETDISILEQELDSLEGVTSVKYISKVQALEVFQSKHKDNKEVQDALREIGQNPLNPSLVVQTAELADYSQVINSLDKLSKHDIIESRNFDDHEALLNSMNTITGKTRQAGMLVSLIFIIITILVVFNAIRIAIYTHNKEIRIMKLVGASDWFIRAPFLVEGATYALVGVISIIAIFYPFIHLLQPYLSTFFNANDLNLINYFNSNFITIFGLEFVVASLINIVASLWAMRNHLKV